MRKALVAGVILLAGTLAWPAESGGKVYPLKPGDGSDQRVRGGWIRASLGKDGLGEVPFPTASGKLRLKSEGKKVFVDANDDGQFAETEVVRSGAKTSVAVTVVGKPYGYPLMVYGSGRSLILMSMASLETQVDGVDVRLLDGNCNGQFGELKDGAGQKGDMLMVGKSAPQPLGRYASIGTSVQQIEVLDGGANLRLTPYDGPTSKLTVAVEEGYTLTAQLVHKENGFLVNLKSGEASSALPGTYTISRVQLAAAPKVMLYGQGGSDLEVKAGENTLAFGLPLKLGFKAVNTDKGVSVKEANLIGSGGEAYRAYNSSAGNKCTLTTSLRSGAEAVPGAKLSYG